MAMPVEGIEREALLLPKDARARLVLHLLDSMDERSGTVSPDIEREWIAEARLRYDAYLRGEEQATPAEEVFATLRKEDR